MHSRTSCQQADQNDSLADFRQLFDIPSDIIYLDGNSLGAMPKTALARGQQTITQEWGKDLIRSWNDHGWFDLPSTLGDKLAPLIGSAPGETVVTDALTLNVFKLLAAAVRMQQSRQPNKRVILAERDSFPADLYMAEGLIELLQQGYELRLIDDKLSLEQALSDNQVAVVLLSHVNYRTGALFDMAAVTQQAHAKEALIIWDLAHSAGALQVELNAAQADFAAGCTYKYLNGGPGAPAFVWVAKRHHEAFWQPLSGWWGHAQPFAMETHYKPAQGIRRSLCGTQPIVSMRLLECGLDIARQADMVALRQKSLALTDLFIQLVAQRCSEHPLTLITPQEHAQRGSHVSYRHPQGYPVMQALIAAGVIGDYREPEVLRFGITPLYLSHTDIWDAVDKLKTILDSGSWDKPEFHRRGSVT